MRLSEAIRLGATLKPQYCYGSLYSLDGQSSCALGAALDALGVRSMKIEMEVLEYLQSRYPYLISLHTPPLQCPNLSQTNWVGACPFRTAYLRDLITHLNDCHLWSRERIADWIEPYEPSPSDTRPDTRPESSALHSLILK